MLAFATWFQVALALFALAIIPFDKRRILGINPWIKPLKFDISVGIFLVTIAGVLSGLQGFERARWWIGGDTTEIRENPANLSPLPPNAPAPWLQ